MTSPTVLVQQRHRACLHVGLALLVTLTACTTPPTLPPAARLALEQHWRTLPGQPAIRILRAWPGQTTISGSRYSPDQTTPALAQAEVWCVAAIQTLPDNGESLRTIWFVARSAPDAPWNAALLMSMSALWPYIACGQASPPSISSQSPHLSPFATNPTLPGYNHCQVDLPIHA